MQQLYPLTFDLTTLTRDYMWGGERLKQLVPGYPDNQPLAEIWVVSDRPEEEKIGSITNGPLAGTTIGQLMQTQSSDLLGKVASVNGKFPLLVKLMDVKLQFSLQVHPSETVAEKLGSESKPECWVLLPGTNPQGSFYAGLRSGVDRATFESTLRSGGDLRPLLHTLTPSVGDCLNIPAGRLHTAHQGTFFYEVQRNSDTTYRVSDWGRMDPKTGQPRQIHIEEALQSINFDDVEPTVEMITTREEQGAAVEELIETPYFTIERWTSEKTTIHKPASIGSFEILTIVKGSAIVSGNDQSVALEQFGTTLVPASVPSCTIQPSGSVTYLRTFVETNTTR